MTPGPIQQPGPQKRLLKRLVRVAGVLLIVASFAFIGRELVRHWAEIAVWRPTAADLGWLGVLSGVYGASLYLLAESWHRIVGLFGPLERRLTYRSYTDTQIARYLPGNVAHLLGRAYYLYGQALSARQVGAATLIELAVTPVAAIVAVLLLAGLLPGMIAWPAPLDRAAGLALPVLVLVGAGLALALAAPLVGYQPALARRIRTIAVTVCLSTVFMLCLGALFAGVLGLLADIAPGPAASAAVIAWLIGYATPGAPGGLGPREAALTVLLGEAVAPGALLLAVVLFRLVTIAGDILCFGSGRLIWPRPDCQG